MTNVRAIHAVGTSIVTYLQQAYPADLREQHPCEFELVSTDRLATMTEVDSTRVTLFLYRVTIDPSLRNARRMDPNRGPKPPLSLGLHYLLSVWAATAATEQIVLAWVLNQLHRRPVLNRPSLDPDASWLAEDVIHVLPEELSNEDVMRIWDALEPSYRISFAYVARVVRVDSEQAEDSLPVVDSRFAFGGAPAR